jgi:predicted transcriptional regulator
MFNDMSDLAESKLLILYIFDKVDMPLSNSTITQIVLENNLINYFLLQQYLSELIKNAFLVDIKDERLHMLTLSESGKSTLHFFINRIPEKKKKFIDEYILNNIVNIRKEIQIIAEYVPTTGDKYMVSMKLLNGTDVLVDLKLPAFSNNEAKSICSRWKDESEEIYNKILEMFKNKES